jgi:hypothetical protein
MGYIGIRHNAGRKLKTYEIKKELNQEYGDENHRMKAEFTSIKGKSAYGILSENGKPITILTYIIKNGTKEFMYKSMTELDGPVICDCPIKLLNIVPCPDNKYAKQWRENVLTTKVKPNISKILKIGDVVKYNILEDSSYGNIFIIVNITKRGRTRVVIGNSKKNCRDYILKFSRIKQIIKI